MSHLTNQSRIGGYLIAIVMRGWAVVEQRKSPAGAGL